MQAVLGETEIPGLFVAVSAYKGFMTSPAVGRLENGRSRSRGCYPS